VHRPRGGRHRLPVFGWMKKAQNSVLGELALRLAGGIDRGVKSLGRVLAWCNLAVIAVILTQVVLRYGFHHGLVSLEELMWHLYALAAMAGLSYAMVSDDHIRIDVLRRHLGRRVRAGIEIAGILLLLLPFLLVILHHSLEWVAASYRLGETSPNPTGLPYRWLIKGVIPASFLLLVLAALARLIREIAVLRGVPEDLAQSRGHRS
jgi:TRAP-type mannitol/chloroaromatic compound transport system permease small subunit